MKILHVIDCMNERQGGPSVSVPALAAAQAKLGHRVTIVCRDYGYLGPMAKAQGVEVRSVPSSRWTKGQGGWGCAFRRLVEQEAEKADVVHNHGLWLAANYYARRAALKAGKPLVISPRGMLEGWSLGRSIVRKTVAWHLFERKNLESAALFHATSESEAQAIATALCLKLKLKNKDGSAKGDRRQQLEDRKTDNPPNSYLLSSNSSEPPRIVVAGEDSESQSSVGPRSTAAGEVWPRRSGALQSDSSWPRMVVAPNGVDIPKQIPKREVLERKFPELKGRRWVLFMSRIHPKKGLDLLLEAWKQLRADGRLGLGLGLSGVTGGGPRVTGSHPSSISDLPSTNSAPALVIAGPEEDRGYAEKWKREGGAGVVWTGELRGEEKWAALGQAEFLVLPSHSENFGIVVAESLAAGRPAVTTVGTPWGRAKPEAGGRRSVVGGQRTEGRGRMVEGGCAGGTELAPGDRRKEIADRGSMNLELRGCGVICEVTDLRRGLERMLKFSDEEREEMGARGRQWMKEEFSWKAGAEKLIAGYKEIGVRR